MISRVKGDVSCPQAASNQIIIAHVCSDIGFLGSEFVQIVAKKWPEVRNRFLSHPDHRKLGSVILSEVDDNILIAHMIAQRGVRSKKNPNPVDIRHLLTCLEATRRLAEAIHATLHLSSDPFDNLEEAQVSLNEMAHSLDIYIYEKLAIFSGRTLGSKPKEGATIHENLLHPSSGRGSH